MKRLHACLRCAKRFPTGATQLNCLAAMIGLVAVAVMMLNSQARPAGAGVDRSRFTGTASLGSSRPTFDVANPFQTPGEAQGKNALTQNIAQQLHSAAHTSKLALQLHVALLELGKHRLAKLPDYRATFTKQERLDGEGLSEEQTLQVKLRHAPFSVYLKWEEGGDTGREVLYVEGQNEGKMIVHLGGLKGKLLPNLKLEPTGSTAMKESRHPVTEMGLIGLADALLKYRQRDLTLSSGVRWELLNDQKACDRDCICFINEYEDSKVEPVYRKTITYIDRELLVPICVRNYGWQDSAEEKLAGTALDEATLIEYYGYSDIQFEQRLSDADFDRTNTEYKFRR